MFIQQLFNGIMQGGLYALLAVGFALLFGVLRLINFSHGSVFMLGAYLTYIFITNLHFPFLLAGLISIILSGFVGIVVERISVAPLRKRKMPFWLGMITTFGMALIIENLSVTIFGGSYRSFPTPIKMVGFEILGAHVTNIQLLTLGVAMLLMILLVLFTQYTWLGRAFRAVSQSEDTSSLMGINANLIVALGFFISGVLAGSAGILVAMYQNIVSVNMGLGVGLKGFFASVMGGIGSIPGAVLGGFLLGIIESLTSAYISADLKNVISFTALILVLMWRPMGLLGKEQL